MCVNFSLKVFFHLVALAFTGNVDIVIFDVGLLEVEFKKFK